MIKGRSSSHVEFMVILGISLFGFPFFFFGSTIFLNGYLDTSATTTHSVVVINKWIKTHKNDKDYKVSVNSWREGRSYEKLDITKQEYRRVQPNETMMDIRTKPGKYGYEVLVSYKIEY